MALAVVQQAARPPWPSPDDGADDGANEPRGPACPPPPPAFCALVEACWHQDPRRRPSFKALLAPPPHHALCAAQGPSDGRGVTASWLEYACTPPVEASQATQAPGQPVAPPHALPAAQQAAEAAQEAGANALLPPPPLLAPAPEQLPPPVAKGPVAEAPPHVRPLPFRGRLFQVYTGL